MRFVNRFQSSVLGMILAMGLSCSAMAEEVEPPKYEPLPLSEIRRFADIYERIKSAYVEPVSDEQLLLDAVRGMMSGLDPHSTYLDKDEFNNLREHTSGEYGGLGIELTFERPYVKVISPIDGSPAKLAGVRSGDLISELDGTPVGNLTMTEIIDQMRGEPGAPIELTILRETEEKPLTITVVRDIIPLQSVRSQMLEDGYGYARISQFQANTGKDLRKALEALNQKSLRGFILDLRDNPGGLLSSAVEVVDAFIDEGKIVYTEGRIEHSDQTFSATADTVMPDTPLIILINAGSASASEIVAGALQDQKRAILMGETTFGKGSVQTILPVGQNEAIKITTARYFTPNGRSIQATGIEPDVYVGAAEVTFFEARHQVTEKDLSGHLENSDAENNNDKDDEHQTRLREDFQLFEALSLLKALHIVNPAR
ncbi:MAG: S41 family peptidase [Pontibacterium sp.]